MAESEELLMLLALSAPFLLFVGAVGLLWILQQVGVGWAYRIGFPIAEGWGSKEAYHWEIVGLEVKQRGDMVLIREVLYPNLLLSRWDMMSGLLLVGLVERVGKQTHLRFATNVNTTFVWGTQALMSTFVVVGSFFAPDIAWNEVVLIDLVFLLVMSPVMYFQWRCFKRMSERAEEYARRAGFGGSS